MTAHLRPAIVLLILLTVITGLAYPAVVTAIAQVVFRHQANGSLIVKDGKAVGSTLIGQSFDDPKYFWGRPSATSPFGYNAGASAGSNLSPTNPALIKSVQDRVDALRAADPGNTAPVPVDLVTASGSGLDPHISPAAAEYHGDPMQSQASCPRAVSHRVPQQLAMVGPDSKIANADPGRCAAGVPADRAGDRQFRPQSQAREPYRGSRWRRPFATLHDRRTGHRGSTAGCTAVAPKPVCLCGFGGISAGRPIGEFVD